jgi:hypothetical protein
LWGNAEVLKEVTFQAGQKQRISRLSLEPVSVSHDYTYSNPVTKRKFFWFQLTQETRHSKCANLKCRAECRLARAAPPA